MYKHVLLTSTALFLFLLFISPTQAADLNSLIGVKHGGVLISAGDTVERNDLLDTSTSWEFSFTWPNSVSNGKSFLGVFRGTFGNIEGGTAINGVSYGATQQLWPSGNVVRDKSINLPALGELDTTSFVYTILVAESDGVATLQDTADWFATGGVSGVKPVNFSTLVFTYNATPQPVNLNSIQEIWHGGHFISEGDLVFGEEITIDSNFWEWVFDWPNAVSNQSALFAVFRGEFGNIEGSTLNQGSNYNHTFQSFPSGRNVVGKQIGLPTLADVSTRDSTYTAVIMERDPKYLNLPVEEQIEWFVTGGASGIPPLKYSLLTLEFKRLARTPVVIVPGILGSRLDNDDLVFNNVWPNIPKMINEESDFYLNELILNSNGEPITNITPTDIFRNEGNLDFFDTFVLELETNGYKESIDLFVFPYDWRLRNQFNANQLKIKIDEILQQTGSNQVDIVAHSMGGLVSKYYIKHLDNNNNVRKFINLATPHLGAPKAAKILLYGDNLDICPLVLGIEKCILNEQTLKNIAQNMPSIYQLLPSQQYFDSNNPDYENYLFDLEDFDNDSVVGKLTHGQSLDFLANTGRNTALLSEIDTFHTDLDNWNGADFNVETINIIGCALPTIGKIFVNNQEQSGSFKYALKYIDGDKTVPLRSAETIGSSDVYYVNNIEHAKILGANGVRQLITSTLEGSVFDISLFPQIRTDKNGCGFSGKVFSVHSPVELHIYNSQNNHVGPVENGDIEIGIPGVIYDIIEDNKFAFLPEGDTYKIEMTATDTGSFSAGIETIENVDITETLSYTNIPLTTLETNAFITLSPNQTEFLIEIDQDGDGNFETIIEPDTRDSFKAKLEEIRVLVPTLDIKNNLKKRLLNKLDKIEKKYDKAQEFGDKKKSKKIKKVEKDIKKIIKDIDNKKKKEKIVKEEAKLLISLLNELRELL